MLEEVGVYPCPHIDKGEPMGFLDKAKKMAEQAQTKLDEVQKQFNESSSRPPGSAGSQAPPVEYDKHGRPIRSEAPPATQTAPPPAEPVGPPPAAPTPPHGDPLAEQTPAPPPAPPAAPTPDPAAPKANEDDQYAPPKLTGGDPLAG
jgi:hypothetical protein